MAGRIIARTTSVLRVLACPPFPSTKEISLWDTRQPGASQQEEEFDSQRYHRPTDEYRPEWNFAGDAKMARFGFILGWEAMSLPAIRWNAGDEFEAARKRSMGSGTSPH